MLLAVVSNEPVRLATLLSGGFRRGRRLIQTSSRCAPAVDLTLSHKCSNSQLGVIELVDEYTEKYLVAHAILDGAINSSCFRCLNSVSAFRLFTFL